MTERGNALRNNEIQTRAVTSASIMSPVWLTVWALSLSVIWLIPVHFPPWSTYGADLWTGVMVLIAGCSLLIRSRLSWVWDGLSCWCAVLTMLPWLQWLSGLLPFAGQAWVSSGYMLGFLLALLIGAQWEAHSPGQLIAALCGAIMLAAIVSVGLQLYVWLYLADDGALGLWALGDTGNRPSANLGQPNQLATLLIWGLLSCLWAYSRGALGALGAICLAVYLILGLSLAQSRTGFVAVTVTLMAIWWRQKQWSARQLPWVATGLYVFMLACPTVLRWLGDSLLLGREDVLIRGIQVGESRLDAWRLFVQAILEQPLMGYGWTEVSSAQISIAEQLPRLGGIFSHSHNLFLDLMLWCGIPVAVLTMVILFRWFWLKHKALQQTEDHILYWMLVIIGIHAMLEFPLQYAYFLLPVGLLMGVLNVRLGTRVVWTSAPTIPMGLLLVAVLGLGVTVRDYAQVDASYTLLRLEQGLLGQGRPPLGGAPDVWVLTNYREWIKIGRFKARANMSAQELNDMAVVTRSYPSLSLVYRLATALALNGRPEEALMWLGKICKFTSEQECQLAQRSWKKDSANDPRLSAVSWPK